MSYEIYINLDDSRGETPGQVGEAIRAVLEGNYYTRFSINRIKVRKVKENDNATSKQTRRHH